MLNDKQKKLLLMPKALPTGSHGFNLRLSLRASEWERLKRKVFAKASYVCELCGATDKRLEAHEIWSFDFELKLQVLETMAALCMHCHRIQHALLLKLHVDQGIAHPEHTIKHFNKLTGQHLTESQFYAEATRNANEFEKIEWEIWATKEFEELLK